MRRVIHKRIRRTGDGLDLAADLNVDLALNVGHETVPAPAREDERPGHHEPGEPARPSHEEEDEP